MDKLNQIKKRSEKYKKRYHEQEEEFKDRVENVIRYDIGRYGEYEEFFKGLFEELEGRMEGLRDMNKGLRRKIKEKEGVLKNIKKSNVLYFLTPEKDR